MPNESFRSRVNKKGNAMTKKLASNKGHVSALLNAAALSVVGAAIGLFSIGASAQGTAKSAAPAEVLARANPADLEKAFWICDHAATNHGVGGGMAIACGVITEDLKMKKFNGDFDRMVAWWRQNKAAEHQVLAASGRATSGQ